MKYLICDMSGILSLKGKNNEVLLDALSKMKNINYTFCTGKGFKGSLFTVKGLDFSLPIICENGGLLITKKGDIISKHVIEFNKIKELVMKLITLNYKFISCCNIETNNYIFLYNKKNMHEKLKEDIFFGEEVYDRVDDFLYAISNLEIVRLIYRGDTICEKIFNSIKLFDVSVSEQEYYSFCLKGVNKKNGINEIISRYNISNHDIIIIGNDYNDIPMFDIDCFLRIAVGSQCSKLNELADVNISLEDLPNYLSNVDKNIKK